MRTARDTRVKYASVAGVRRAVPWRRRASAAVAALGIIIAGEAQALRSMAGSLHNTPTIVRRSAVPGLHRDHFAWAVAPVPAYLAVCGDASAPAFIGFGYRVDWDNTTLGDSGRRDQTYHQWRVTVNGGAPSSRIACLDPITGATVYLDADQHGAFLYYHPIVAGTYVVEHRLFNSSGLYCGWRIVATITRTAPDSAKYGYYDPSVGSSGDGLSWAQAVKTNAEAVTLANLLGAGATIFCRSGTVAGDGDRPTVANVRFTADPDAVGAVTITISANYSFVEAGGSTDGLTIDSLTFAGTNGRICNPEVDGPKNICLYNLSFGGIDSVAVASGSSRILGVAFINLTETSSTTSELYFSNDTEGFLAWGVLAPVGSTTEHTFRFQNITDTINSAFHVFAYCTLGNSAPDGKCSLRWLAKSNLWVTGCKLSCTGYLIGFVSPGGSSVGGNTMSISRCHFYRQDTQVDTFQAIVRSSWNEGTFSNCYFDDVSLYFEARDTETGSHTVDSWNIVNCTFRDCIIRWSDSLTNTPTNQVVRNCQFDADTIVTTSTLIQTKGLTGMSFENNHFSRANATDEIMRDQSASTNYDYTELTALGWVSGSSRATTTYNASTLEPNQGLTTGSMVAPMPHVSYGGVRYSYEEESIPAGAWRSTVAAGEFPEYLYYNIGNLLLKVVA